MVEPQTDYIQVGTTGLDITFIKFSTKYYESLDDEPSDDNFWI